MFSCRDVTERASDERDGRLTAAERFALGAHLAVCIHCRRYLRQFARTISLLRDLPPEPVPEVEAETKLLAAFREARGGPASKDG